MGESVMNGFGGMGGEVYDYVVIFLFFILVEVVC